MRPLPPLRPLAFVLLIPAALFAQGTLTPPGAPAPTMRSLTELDAKLESRIAIETLPGDASGVHVISAPGSYYLRGNLTVAGAGKAAIRILSSNVTVDLGGFHVIGPGRSVAGVAAIQALQGEITVRNGTIRHWQDGVAAGTGTRLEDLAITDVLLFGINAELNSTLIRRCTVRGAGSTGIAGGIVEQCTVVDVGAVDVAGDATGISASVVRDCQVSNIEPHFAGGASFGIRTNEASGCRVSNLNSPGVAYGFSLRTASVGSVHSCIAETINATGAAFGFNVNIARDCTARGIVSNTTLATGFDANVIEACVVTNITGVSNSTRGIECRIARGCSVSTVSGGTGSAYGIDGGLVAQCVVDNIQTSGTGSSSGIFLGSGGHAESNRVATVRNFGIRAASSATVLHNTIISVGTVSGVTDGACIYVTGTDNRIEGNTLQGGTNADYGIRIVTNARNLVMGNRASGTFTGAATGALVDTPEFNIVAGNRFGPLVSTFAATGEITATNPFANFSD